MKSILHKIKASDKIGYLMSLPYLISFALFVAFPLVFSFILIFHKWNIITPMEWVGLRNFIRLFQDVQFLL